MSCPVQTLTRSGDSLRLMKALPVFAVLGAQTAGVIITLALMYFSGQQNSKDISELKQFRVQDQQQRVADMALFTAKLDAINQSITSNIGPSAVNTNKILILESQMVELKTQVGQIRETQLELARDRFRPQR